MFYIKKILPLFVVVLVLFFMYPAGQSCKNENKATAAGDSTTLVVVPPVKIDGETTSIVTVPATSLVKKDIKTQEGEKNRAGKSKVAAVTCCTDYKVVNQCCCDSVLSKYVWLRINRKDSVFIFKNKDPYLKSCKDQISNFVPRLEKIDSLYKRPK